MSPGIERELIACLRNISHAIQDQNAILKNIAVTLEKDHQIRLHESRSKQNLYAPVRFTNAEELLKLKNMFETTIDPKQALDSLFKSEDEPKSYDDVVKRDG